MDKEMPIIDGYKATEEIIKLCNTPIIGITGNALQSDQDEFISKGLTDLLIKPVNLATFLKCIDKYVNK